MLEKEERSNEQHEVMSDGVEKGRALNAFTRTEGWMASCGITSIS